MADKSNNLNAQSDLAYVQRLLQRIENQESSVPMNKFAADANIFFQGICLVLALIFLAIELTTNSQITNNMLQANQDSELGVLGMKTVLFILGSAMALFYYISWRASKNADRDYTSYLEHNFKNLKNLSLVSDLSVKFAVLFLIVIGGEAQYVSLILVLFMADYLIQSRFFHLPAKLSMILGLMCFGLAATLFVMKDASLIYALGIFVLLATASVVNLLKNKRSVVKA